MMMKSSNYSWPRGVLYKCKGTHTKLQVQVFSGEIFCQIAAPSCTHSQQHTPLVGAEKTPWALMQEDWQKNFGSFDRCLKGCIVPRENAKQEKSE